VKLVPKNDWVLVRLDPIPTTRGSLVVLEDTSANLIRTATVVATGPGKRVEDRRIPVGVESGEKVAFSRWHLEHKSGKQRSSLLAEFGADLGLIRGSDILFAYPAGQEIQIG
jgi:co-chaperonin GroES (HSP10)